MPFYRLFYHVVWGTKNREPLIRVEFADALHNVIAAKAGDLGGIVYAVGGIEDHVHLVVTIPPHHSLSGFIGQVKGNSSHFANYEYKLPDPFKWQAEYGVLSFGSKQLDTVVKYVKNQREHHAENTLIPFLERLDAN